MNQKSTTVSRVIAHFLTGYEEGGVQLPQDLVDELNWLPVESRASFLNLASRYADTCYANARQDGVTPHEYFARLMDKWLAEP